MVKKQGLVLIIEFLTTQQNHIPLLCLASAVFTITGQGKEVWFVCALLSLFPFFAYIIRTKVKKVVPFFATYILLILSFVIFLWLIRKGIACNIVCGIILAGYTVYSLEVRFRESKLEDRIIQPVAAIGIMAGAALIQTYYRKDGNLNPMIIIVVSYLCLYFLNLYLTNYLKFVTVNEKATGHIPKRKLFSLGSYLVIAFTAVSCFFLGSFTDLGLGSKISTLLKQFFLMVLRVFFSLFKNETPVEEIVEKTEEVGENFLPFEFGSAEPAAFTKVLNILFDYLMAGISIFIAILFIGLVVKMILRIFRRKYKNEDFTIGPACSEVKEKLQKTKEHSKTSFAREYLKPAGRIRRTYKKAIQGQKNLWGNKTDSTVLKTSTARECCHEITTEDSADILSALYEKARYSSEECSGEEAKVAKKQMMHMLTIKR